MANRYTFSHSNNLNSAHLGFTSGLQADLNTLITNGGASEGTFYLTTDTHRLYIGREVTADTQATGTFTTKTIPIPVNEGIQTVTNLSDLPSAANPGEFYYVTGSNILCIYSGSGSNTSGWVQINANTDTDTIVSSNSVTSATEYQLTNDTSLVAGKTYYAISNSEPYTYTAIEPANLNVSSINTYYEPYRIKYTLTTVQRTYDRNTNSSSSIPDPANITTEFYINSSDIANVLSISAGLTRSAASSNASTISLDGGVSNGHTVTIAGGTNVTLDTTNTNTIAINSASYNLARGTISNDSTPVILKKDNANVDSVYVTAGNHLSLDTSDASGITINHDTPGAATQTGGTDDQYGETSSSTKTINGDTSQTIKIPTIKKDAYGHISSISESTVTLRGIEKVETTATNGQIYLKEQGNANIAISDAHALSYQITVDGSTNTVDNKGNLGTFYSASGVDARIEQALQSANALTYKGTVGSQSATTLTLPTENVQIGDTYLVDTNVANVYTKTLDTTLTNGKTYYTLSDGAFTAVQSPSVGNLSNYYEKVIADGVEGGDLLIATGNEYVPTQDTTVNGAKTYYTRSGSGTSASPYIYTKVTPAAGANPASLEYYENTGIIQDAVTWTYVPSGDDVDTHYSLTSNSANKTITLHNTTTNADINSIQFISGTYITPANIETENSTYKVKFDHNVSNVTPGDYGAGGTGTAASFTNSTFNVPNFHVDEQGHITSASTSTYTLPSAANYLLTNKTGTSSSTYDTTLRLFKDNAESGTISLTGDSTGGVSVGVNSSSHAIEIKHTTLVSAVANNDSLTNFSSNEPTVRVSNDTLPVLTALDIDNYGHVSAYKVTNYLLPDYTVNAGAISSNKATVALRKNNADVNNKISFTSDNLTITDTFTTSGNTTERTYTVNLEWGSFSSSNA